MARAILYATLGVGAIIIGLAVLGWLLDLSNLTFFGMFMVVGFLVIIAGSFYDIWQRMDLSPPAKLLWSAGIIVFPILGTIVYMFARPPAAQVTYHRDQA